MTFEPFYYASFQILIVCRLIVFISSIVRIDNNVEEAYAWIS